MCIRDSDSIVNYNGSRYRAYVYIKPSKMRVIKTIYTEDGISMDNVYYDNVMHICAVSYTHLNDETLGIDWMLGESQMLLSPKDKEGMAFRDAVYFE